MGYYSDVRVSTTTEGYEFIRKHMKAACGMEPSDIFGYIEEQCNEIGAVFGWNCVKWYDSFPEVQALERALDAAESIGIDWEYMVVGEEGDEHFLSTECAYEKLACQLGVRHTIEVW